jgi:type IV pilus assembly protein PilB
MSDSRYKLNISSSEVQDAFNKKMQTISLKENEGVVQQKAAQLGLQYMYLYQFPISPEVLTIFSKEKAAEHKIISFYYNDKDFRVGLVNPENSDALAYVEEVTEALGANLSLFMISEYSHEVASKLYANVPVFRKVETDLYINADELTRLQEEVGSFKVLENRIEKANITTIVTMILASAFNASASDIHIEAEEDGIAVRFRIDGVLQEVLTLDKGLWKQIISRIKLLARLKLNINDAPQDGRFTIVFSEDNKVDIRTSTLPTAYGESVVMRILKSSVTALKFEDMGLRGRTFERLVDQIQRPNGMIITTGPTGSGKTTTLYAILNKLNTHENKIITLEDPVEYKLQGVNQSQIDSTHGYTFADGLRSILRQDPDIIMVGELRDHETADVAINASLTGHLVISTIHTNSAAAAVPRFLAMGVQPFLLAPSLNAIIGQRLVRRICPHCKEEHELDSKTLQTVLAELSTISHESGEVVDTKNLKFYKGAGCEQCNGLGYKGRIGIYEILIMNKEIEDLILSGHVSEYDMRDIGMQHGMVTMLQDGLLKALDGITSVEEVFRVTF